MSTEEAQEERSRMAMVTVSRSAAVSQMSRIMRDCVSDTTNVDFNCGKGRSQQRYQMIYTK